MHLATCRNSRSCQVMKANAHRAVLWVRRLFLINYFNNNIKFTIMITDEKIIEAQIDRAAETEGELFGMSYEQGVRDALEWIMYGEENEPPIE